VIVGLRTWLGLKKPRDGRPGFVDHFGSQKSYAQLYQDLWVLSETGRKRGGFFIEIGAFDGVTLSNSYLLEKKFGWTGILVEPNPVLAARIRRSRRATLCTLPVDGASGKDVTMMFVSDFPELSSMQENAAKDHLADHRKNGTEVIQRTISLNDLLAEHSAPLEIDFISIDTEGNEPDILSTFDFDRYRVQLFCVEHNDTDANELLDRLMLPKGYERVYREWSQWDAWYRRSR
jgi:FkbM family methyltransferase